MNPWLEFVLVFMAAMSGAMLGARATYRRLEKRLWELEARVVGLEARLDKLEDLDGR
jgi:hypothetical protein